MNRNLWATGIAIVAVIVVLILGFRFLGSPAQQRKLQADTRRAQALAALAQQISFAWEQSGKVLPANLDKITITTKKDIFTGKPYDYHPKQGGQYELCATFAVDNRQLPDTNTADPWLHPKGDYCFQLDASQPVPQAPYNYY